MDHMRISDNEPSSVILSKKKVVQKLKRDVQKVPYQAKVKWDGVINPQNYNCSQFSSRKILMLSKATNQPKSTVELGYMCPRGLLGPPAVILTK